MKYIILIYIALGLVLSMLFTIEYDCTGEDLFPTYYGSPFVFKQKSVGSSMTFFYSVFGVLVNVIIWCIPLILVHKLVQKRLENSRHIKWAKTAYNAFIVVLICSSTLNILMEYAMMGNGFDQGQNYWIFDVDDEAEKWGVECKGDWMLFE